MYQNAEELAFFRKSNFTIVCRVSNIYSGFLSRTGALQGTRVVRGSRTFLRKKGVFPMFYSDKNTTGTRYVCYGSFLLLLF